MELAAESEFDVTIVNETVDQAAAVPLVRHAPRNTGCKLPLYHQLLVEDFGAVLAGACFQRIASVS